MTWFRRLSDPFRPRFGSGFFWRERTRTHPFFDNCWRCRAVARKTVGVFTCPGTGPAADLRWRARGRLVNEPRQISHCASMGRCGSHLAHFATGPRLPDPTGNKLRAYTLRMDGLDGFCADAVCGPEKPPGGLEAVERLICGERQTLAPHLLVARDLPAASTEYARCIGARAVPRA